MDGIYGSINEAEPTKRIADDEDLNISDSMGDIVSKGTMTLKGDEEDLLPGSHNLVHDLEERAVELKTLHPNVKHTERQKEERDAKHNHTINLCQRDYTHPCPLGFRHVSVGNGDTKCIPPTSYSGPCIGQELIYREMPEEEKIAWAHGCLANWPCVQCRRRYSDMCPEKWELDGDKTKGFICRATQEYQGPCKEDEYSFLSYNIAMQKQWSRRCYAWWPCDPIKQLGKPPDGDLPITMRATLYRIKS